MAVESAPNIANILLNFGGVALAGLVAFLSARHISDRNAKTTATAKLRAAFAPALAELALSRSHKSTHEAPDVDGFLRTALPGHTAAVEEYRFFVSPNLWSPYERAWEEYREAAIGGVFVAGFPGMPPHGP